MEAHDSDSEVEWQLEAQDLRLVLRWIEVVAASPDGAGDVTLTPGRTINQVDTYVDTADRRLDRAGYSVRLRRARRGHAEATLKSLDGIAADGLRVRLELAEDVELEDPAALAEAPGVVGERVRALVGSRKLVPLFDLHTRRRVFELEVGGSPNGELVLDDTAIREHGGGIISRLRRVEIEVPQTAVDGVRPFVENLRRACGLQPAALSKYEAALAATGRYRAEPPGFGPTAAGPTDTIGQVALATLRRHFSVLLAKEPGTRLGDDIEELHEMRVASRRLRAAIALFSDFLPTEAIRLRPELAWIGQTIGAVRDLDVQLAQLDEWTERLPEPDRAPLDRLRALLEWERRAGRAEMLQALDSPRYDRFVRRFATMLRSRSGARTPPAVAAAPDLVERRHRGLRKAMKRIGPDSEPEAYHRMRIAGKRFRYALEFLSRVYPGETKQLVRRTVALQDLLGAYQDAEVAVTRLRELAAQRENELGPKTIFAMGELAERYRAGAAEIPPKVPRAYRRVAGKEWKRLRARMEAARPPAATPPARAPDGEAAETA